MFKRVILIFFVIAIVVGGGWVIKDQFFQEEKPQIISSAVTIGDIEDSVLTSGILKPVKLVAVGAQVSGRITSLAVSLGQKVVSGELIAEIDSVTQKNDLQTAKAVLAQVVAQKQEKIATLKQVKSDFQRQKQMIKQRAISQADYESAEATVLTTQAQISALNAEIVGAQLAVETAEANLGYTRITAPIDGTVLALVSQEGQTVNAAQSAPTIVVLGELDVMTVRAEISEADIIKVHPGQDVYFTVLGDPDHQYNAVLESIEPAPESIVDDSSLNSGSSSASSTTSTEAIYYNGLFNIPNPDGILRTYMTAEVHIVLNQAKGVLMIPASALGPKEQDGGHRVQVVDDLGNISIRSVDIGLNNKINVEIKSGLKEGERVSVSHTFKSSTSSSSKTRRGPPGMRF